MNKKIIVLVAVLVIAILGGYFFPQAKTEVKDFTVGATPGPDLEGNSFSVGGVRQWSYRAGMITASSTVCKFKSPGVPSVLVGFSATFTTVPTYATSYMVGSGTQNATTTSVIANANITLAASATASLSTSASTTNPILAANTYVNMNYSTSTSVTLTATTFPIVGRCQAIFREI